MPTPNEQLKELETKEQELKPIFHRLDKVNSVSGGFDDKDGCYFGLLGLVIFISLVWFFWGSEHLSALFLLFLYGSFFASFFIQLLVEYLLPILFRRIYHISKKEQQELTRLQKELRLKKEVIEKTIQDNTNKTYRERENQFIEKLNNFVDVAKPFKISKGMMALARKVIESLEEENAQIKEFGYQVQQSDYYTKRFEKLNHFLKTESETSSPNSEELREKTPPDILSPLPTNTSNINTIRTNNPKPFNDPLKSDHDKKTTEQNISDLFPIPLEEISKKEEKNPIKTTPKPNYEILNTRKDLIGHLGEEFIYEEEKRKLREKGLVELSENVKWVSQESDSYGYDIISFNDDGTKKHIEVKTTTGDIHTPFYLTDVELATLKNLDTYIIVRVYDFKTDSRKGSKYTVTKSQLELYYVLEPLSYKVNPKY